MTPEGRVKARVKKLMAEIDTLGRVYQFCPVQNGMGKPGLDFYYCVNGHFVAIETKRRGKKPTPRQQLTIEEIKSAKGLVFVVDDDDVVGDSPRWLNQIRTVCFPKQGL